MSSPSTCNVQNVITETAKQSVPSVPLLHEINPCMHMLFQATITATMFSFVLLNLMILGKRYMSSLMYVPSSEQFHWWCLMFWTQEELSCSWKLFLTVQLQWKSFSYTLKYKFLTYLVTTYSLHMYTKGKRFSLKLSHG